MTETRVTLVRHGEVAAEAVGTHYGQADVDLSQRGREQSRALVARVGDVSFDSVWSSGLVRAHWLAELLAESQSLSPIVREAAFRERDVGAFEGMTYAEAARVYPEPARLAKDEPGVHRPPSGENLGDLRDRVMPAFERLLRAHEGEHVALICHGGPIRVVLGSVLGMPTERLENIRIGHCSRSIVLVRGERRRVELVNAI